MTLVTPKYESSEYYDSEKDILLDGAPESYKREYEDRHNGPDWALFYIEDNPELKIPYKLWNGEIIDIADETDIREDADDDDGRWITTDNGHKVHLNEEGEPDKGNPHVIEQMTTWTPRPTPEKPTKSKANAKLKELATEEDYGAIDKYLYELPVGSTMKLPPSFGDSGEPIPLVKKDDGWYCNAWKMHVSTDELSGWFVDEDDERPVITKIASGPMVKKPLKVEVPDSVMEKYVWNEEAAEARRRAIYADDNREQYRFFADYMNGVGYGESHIALNEYNYHGDTLINGMLRGNLPKGMEQQKEWLENAEQTKLYIYDMTKAIDSNRLSVGATVFRGIQTADGVTKTLGLNMSENEFRKALEDPDFAESLKGRTFSDPAFSSTSIDRKVPQKGGFDRAARMEIYCPPGTKGVYCGDYLRITDEAEYILQRGSQFVILNAYAETADYYTRDKRLVLEVAVVNQEPQPIPELKHIYDPKQRIVDAANNKEKLPKTEIQELYPNMSDGALDDIVRLHEKRDYEETYYVLTEEMFVGNISPEDAGELYAYTYHVPNDMHGAIDRFTSKSKEKELPANEEFLARVQDDYPDLSDTMANHIATYREMAYMYRLMAKEEEESGKSDRSSSMRAEADKMKICEDYAIRAYNHAKERSKS